MKFLKCLAAFICLQGMLGGLVSAAEKKIVLYQVSTIDALLGGVLDGEIEYKSLKEHGDFGIGTFNGLDGEMLALDGEFYQIKSDGSVSAAKGDMKTPFCSITFFNPGKIFHWEENFAYEKLGEKLDPLLTSENLIYAVRIDGDFEYIKTRSVPKQNKPYPNLTEVVKTQPTFEFHQVRGTLAGFRFPKYLQGLNVAGYHIHFITSDRNGGGHVLDWKIGGVDVQIQEISDFSVALPHSQEFYAVDLSKDRKAELTTVEQKH